MYTKILQFGALASWGFKNNSIISTKIVFFLSRSKQEHIHYMYFLYFLMKALWILKWTRGEK